MDVGLQVLRGQDASLSSITEGTGENCHNCRQHIQSRLKRKLTCIS